MKKIQTTLDGLFDTLHQLKNILLEEQTLLCAGRIDSIALQKVTDTKSATLATLQYFDESRKKTEEQFFVHAPYESDSRLFNRWEAIQELTIHIHDMNKNNGMLLNQHITYINEAIAILKPCHGQGLYGPDGQSSEVVVGGRKINL